MAQTIHDLFREIDKALEQVRAVGARDEHLSLKLPRAALADFRQLCAFNDPTIMSPSRYRNIPITEWTDGPFMSFSLDHSVTLHNDPMLPTTFYGKGVHDMVVELRNEQAARELTFGDPKQFPLYGERSRCVISPDQFVYADGRPLSDADKRRLFGEPRRSIIAAMHSARRARARKRKPITADDASVHGAISAMQRPGRAHEL